MTGDEIGIKLVYDSHEQAGKVTGKRVVKIRGEWVDVVPPVVIGADSTRALRW